MRTVITIAGSDSIAGAGIQADLKTFAALGVYGTSAVTAVTAQNTTGVADVVPLSAAAVQSQIEQVAQDVDVSAVKTGMLATDEITRTVANCLGLFNGAPLVIDPVLASGGAGARTLLAPDAVLVMKRLLLPRAAIVTPNVAEARALCGVQVDSLADAREAAKQIAALGPAAVVIKGGHLEGSTAVDVLFHQGMFIEFSAPRAPFANVHGTGCTFASAIAAGLALGDDIPSAVQRAKRYVTGAIEQSVEVGRGARILNHFWTPPSAL